MTFATLYSYLGTYLSVRKTIVANEKKIYDAKKYDAPCCSLEKNQQKGLFLLWCLENIACYDENQDKVISVANRWSKNCGDCSVTQAEIEDFMETEKGKKLVYDSDLSGFLLLQNNTWLLQQNGYQIKL